MRVLIAEDDAVNRKGIETFLKSRKFEVQAVDNGQDAFDSCINSKPDLLISDVKMPGMTGLQVLTKLRKQGNEIPILIMTAFATVQDAVEAMKLGANDYLTKPLNLAELLLKIEKIKDRQSLIDENKDLKEQLNKIKFPEMVGTSIKIESIRQQISNAAGNPDIPVMVYGQSGTGKELVARSIHVKSARANGPFVAVNCAAIPDSLIESELFGYKKGAFTGAFQDKKGLFQSAQNGTLFLDEVSEMSVRMQAVLLRALQEQIVYPLGDTVSFKLNVRIIGASNQDLKSLVAKHQFREDLFYRLNVVEMTVPSLAERKEDIPLLIDHFIDSYADPQTNVEFTKELIAGLQNRDWPGNIRQLENAVRTILVMSKSSIKDLADLPDNLKQDINAHSWQQAISKDEHRSAVAAIVSEFEQEFIKHHLIRNNYNISQTAVSIGLSRVSLHKKIKTYNIPLK